MDSPLPSSAAKITSTSKRFIANATVSRVTSRPTDEFIKVEPAAATVEDTPTTTNSALSAIELTVGVVSLVLPEHASPQWVAELIRELNR